MGKTATWFKYGCLGCLGLVVLVIAVVVGVVGLAAMQARSVEVEEREVSQALPETLAAAGRVVLALSDGEFRIEPGRPGEPLRVHAEYDKTSYVLEESFTEGGEDGWVYEVRFERSGGGLSLLKQMIAGQTASVRVLLPTDQRYELDLTLSEGAGEIELGGLWLTSASVDAQQGGFELGIRKPLREPIESFSISANMSGFFASGIAHAAPRRLDVAFNMGGMELDLRGPWSRDAEISISGNMGGGEVRLPRDVRIVGIDAGTPSPLTPSEIDPPTLTFQTSASMGEIEFRR